MSQVLHDFREQLAWGEGAKDAPFWSAVLRKAFPDATGIADNPGKNTGQRLGIDAAVLLASGTVIRVQKKARRKLYPDVLLEVEHKGPLYNAPGWMEQDQQIDYLCYGYVDDRICHVLPWLTLRRTWLHFREEWTANAKAKRGGFHWSEAQNRGYATYGVCVPTSVLKDALLRAFTVDVTAEMGAA
jgi:hypothetical protein